jgi:hypothetical protein
MGAFEEFEKLRLALVCSRFIDGLILSNCAQDRVLLEAIEQCVRRCFDPCGLCPQFSNLLAHVRTRDASTFGSFQRILHPGANIAGRSVAVCKGIESLQTAVKEM